MKGRIESLPIGANEADKSGKMFDWMESIRLGNCKVGDLNNAREKGLISKNEHHDLISRLAERLEKEKEVLELQEKVLEEKLSTDPLTEIPDERFLKPKLQKMIEEVSHSDEGRKLAKVGAVIFMVDMKGLKTYNLKGQIKGGNKALVDFVVSLRQNSRDTDMFFRIGGDEFVAIKPVVNEETGAGLEEVFNLIIKRMQDAVGDTAYIGYSILRKGENKTSDELLDEADQMMVANKALKRGGKS